MHPRIVEGIRLYPSFYYAGAVGPDGFPDITYGQRTIHPVDTGTLLARIFDMAWAAQTSPEYTEAERLQILAFAYGYATHATGDFFAHSLVNEFSEGVFPAVFDIVGGVPDGARELANGLRHLMMEDYFNQATPRFDANGERSLLPNGDISDDETPGIVFDAPMRFIYETLLKPFPDDPSARANTGRTFISVHGANPLSPFNGQLAFTPHGRRLLRAGGVRGGDARPHLRLRQRREQRQVPRPRRRAGHAGGRALVRRRRPLGFRRWRPRPAQATRPSSRAASAARSSTSSSTCRRRSTRPPPRPTSLAGAPLPLAPGQTTEEFFNDLALQIAGILAQGGTPTPQQVADLGRAYLHSWSDAIDDGVRNWGEFGLLTSKGLFDADNRRYWQNLEARNEGADVDQSRADAEAGVGIIDSIIASLDDPNGDGDREDSFIDRHLSPMFGTPKALGAVAGVLGDVTGLLDEVAIGPLRLLMRPLKNAIADVKAKVTDFFDGVILDRYGIDVEQFELLTSLGAKLDVKSIRVGDTVVPIFKPGDREKLHYYMGIEDAPVDLINLPLDAVPGVEFYPDAAGNFGDNIEYDKDKFLAYRNALQLSKMLLLQETDPLGVVPLEQLSKLMNDGLAAVGQPATYDWSKLNVWGDHGGSILTTTLPKPAERPTIVAVDAAERRHHRRAGEHADHRRPRSATASARSTLGLGANTTFYVRKLSATTLVLYGTVNEAVAPAGDAPVDVDAGDGCSCQADHRRHLQARRSRTGCASRPGSSTSTPTSGRG